MSEKQTHKKLVKKMKRRIRYKSIRPRSGLRDFKILLSRVDINARGDDGLCLIHHAAKWKDNEAMAGLLENGADVNALSSNGVTALNFAVENNDYSLVKTILRYEPDRNSKVNLECLALPLTNSFFNDQLPARQVSDQIMDWDAPLVRDTRILKDLLDYGFKLDTEHVSAQMSQLIMAEGWVDIVRTLVNSGWNLNVVQDENAPLHWAVKCRRVEIVDLLISHQADVNLRNVKGMTSLHFAGAYCNWSQWFERADTKNIDQQARSIIGTLLDHGADVNIPDDSGMQPLHYFAQYQSVEMCELLLSRGADLNAKNNEGETVLCRANLGDHYVYQMLVNVGVDVCPLIDRYPREVAVSKSKMLNKFVSVYDLLTKTNSLAMIKSNYELGMDSDDGCLFQSFPSFPRLIICKSIYLDKRIVILDNISPILTNSKFSELPLEIIHEILKHLSNRELQILIDCFSIPVVNN